MATAKKNHLETNNGVFGNGFGKWSLAIGFDIKRLWGPDSTVNKSLRESHVRKYNN